jgi:hypothetical protein
VLLKLYDAADLWIVFWLGVCLGLAVALLVFVINRK